MDGYLSYGDTPEEALESIMDAKERWIAAALEEGWELPEEVFDLSEYSGKFTIACQRASNGALSSWRIWRE